jgi:hypothetical protein
MRCFLCLLQSSILWNDVPFEHCASSSLKMPDVAPVVGGMQPIPFLKRRGRRQTTGINEFIEKIYW